MRGAVARTRRRRPAGPSRRRRAPSDGPGGPPARPARPPLGWVRTIRTSCPRGGWRRWPCPPGRPAPGPWRATRTAPGRPRWVSATPVGRGPVVPVPDRSRSMPPRPGRSVPAGSDGGGRARRPRRRPGLPARRSTTQPTAATRSGRVAAGVGTACGGAVADGAVTTGIDAGGGAPVPVGSGRPSPEGPSTPGGDSSPEGSWGVGSNDTQVPSRNTCGHAWASLPRTTVTPPLGRPGVKPTATRVGRPDALASTANAPANCSQDPVRLTVRNATSGSAPTGGVAPTCSGTAPSGRSPSVPRPCRGARTVPR